MTVPTGFVQVEFFDRTFCVFISKNQTGDPGAIPAREALLIPVSGRVGGGDIASMAVALMSMATSLVECSLAQAFKRRQSDGAFRGGPIQGVPHGLGENYRWLAALYAVCLIAASELGFNAFQGNTVAGAVEDSLGLNGYVTGDLLALIAGFVIFGGICRIAEIADAVMLIMAIGYIALALFVLIIHIGQVPTELATIFQNAFGFGQVERQVFSRPLPCDISAITDPLIAYAGRTGCAPI
ncbi:MAG: alanine:cation symporter family protein [Hyphomicrobiales bacterium]